jgi:signal peptidase II
MKKYLISVASISVILILLDQLTKYFAQKYIENYKIINGVFSLEYTENTGIAFGIEVPQLLVVAGSIIIIPIVFFTIYKELSPSHRITKISSSLIVGGALGNVIDRILNGFVVDFISVWKWPNFNLADTFIVVGILLIICFYGKIKKIN